MISNERTKKAAKLQEEKDQKVKRILEMLRDNRYTVKEVSEIMGIPESSILALVK